MKRIFLIIFLALQTFILVSQARFNRVYRLDSAQLASMKFQSLGVKDNKIYLAGLGNVPFGSTRFIVNGFLAQLDATTGSVIKTNYYGKQFETTYYNNDVMYMDKNSINLIGGNFDSSITFIKTNFDGDVLIRNKLYPNTFPTMYYGNPASITKFGKGYAFTTHIGNFTNAPSKASVVLLDTLGSITKSFDFAETNFNVGPTELIVNKNNNVTFGMKIVALKNDTDSDYAYISQLREIDSSGRTLWTYNTPTNRYIFCDNFVQLANGNYLMWGSEELSDVPGLYRRVYTVFPYLAEINPQRGLVWEKKIPLEKGARPLGFKMLKDSSIVLTGSVDNVAFSGSAFLIRLNSRRDSIYRRNFKTPEFATGRVFYYPNQIEELTNGDLLISGYLLHNIPVNQPKSGEWGWLVRTDSLGCSLEPSSCRVPTKEVEKGPLSIKVFPNPVSEQLTVEYDFTELPDNAILQMTDILGRSVFRQKLIANRSQVQWQTEQMQSGLYLITIYADKRLVWQTKVSVQK